MTKEFKLDGSEFIELNKLMKLMRLVNSGGEANVCISSGDVKVNNAVELQKRKKLRTGDTVEFRGNKVLVS